MYNKQTHFSTSKRTPNNDYNGDDFEALFCVMARGLLLERQTHFLRDVSRNIPTFKVALFEFCMKSDWKMGSKMDQKSKQQIQNICIDFECLFMQILCLMACQTWLASWGTESALFK